MNILIENNKLAAIIENGTRDEFQKYSDAINAAINYYLCRNPFLPITEHQAGYIYFLRILENRLLWKISLLANYDQGHIICSISKNDFQLLKLFQESLNGVILDILKNETDENNSEDWEENIRVLSSLSKALHPKGLKHLTKSLLDKN